MMNNNDHPYYQKRRRESISRAQEDSIARAFGGRKTPASGASSLPHKKGDVHSQTFLIECKATRKQSFRLTYRDLAKAQREAWSIGKIPAVAIHFVTEEAKSIEEREWIVVPRSWLEDHEKA